MPVVKVDAPNALALALTAQLAPFALPAAIEVQTAPSAVIESFPNVSIIIPNRMMYEPAQRLMQQDLGGGNVVWNVGAHTGPVQIRIVATDKLTRARMEQSVIDLLLGREGSPGVFVTPITSTDLVSWVAAWEYEDSAFMDQRAQEREYESVITVNAVIPALVVTTGVQQIDKLVLGLTENFTATFTPSSFGPPLAELVIINQDGSISPA